MLKTVAAELPELYKFCFQFYGKPATLKFGSHPMSSEEKVQQGDPLGPLLFCLRVQPLLMSMQSELVLGFMADFTFGGHRATVASDVLTVVNKGKEFGLSLNFDKCKVIAKNGDKMSGVMSSF